MAQTDNKLSSELGISDGEFPEIAVEVAITAKRIFLETNSKSEMVLACLKHYGINPTTKNARKAALALIICEALYSKEKECEKE